MTEAWQATWWDETQMTSWDRIKEAMKRDWEQTKSDFGIQGSHYLHQTLTDTVLQMGGSEHIPAPDKPNPPRVLGNWDEVELAIRYGYAARLKDWAATAVWNDQLEAALRLVWEGGPDHPEKSWEEVRQYVRHGYEYPRVPTAANAPGPSLPHLRRRISGKMAGRMGDQREPAPHRVTNDDSSSGRRREAIAVALGALLAWTPGSAFAQARRRFDPEHLQLEAPGELHAEMFFGVVAGEFAGRWLAPDFDINVGIAPNVVLGLDGALASEGTPERRFAFDHATADNMWLSAKLGLWQSVDPSGQTAWAFGAQLGPRIPVSPGARGAGFQSVALLGRTVRGAHFVFNAGGLIEPGVEVSRQRPVAVLFGLDIAIPIDDGKSWSLAADVSAVVFVTSDRDQLVTTFGPIWSVTPWLDLGVNGLLGFLAGGDKYGAYLTIAPRLSLW